MSQHLLTIVETLDLKPGLSLRGLAIGLWTFALRSGASFSNRSMEGGMEPSSCELVCRGAGGIGPGVQTIRRDDARPVRDLRGGMASPATEFSYCESIAEDLLDLRPREMAARAILV